MVGLESTAKPLSQILSLAAASLLVVFLLDAAAFRTAVYGQYLEPESYAGSFELKLHEEQTRRVRARNRVVVLGDSSIAEGFSAPLANRAANDNDWFFTNAAVPGATLRTWFYLLRDLDPEAKRYNVVVLPLQDYLDEDGIYPPALDDEADRDIDLNRLIVRLRFKDIFDFPFTYREFNQKLWALRGTAFKGIANRRDLRDFFRGPLRRIEKANFFRDHQREWLDAYAGNPGSLTGLQYDDATNTLTFPPALSMETRSALAEQIQPMRLRVEGRRRAYRKEWIGRIVDHYRNSKAVLIFACVPIRPIHLAVNVQPQGTPIVVQEVQRGNAAAIDQHAFADLEAPETFFDAYHMNSRGRAEFSPRLAKEVISIVSRSRGL